MPFLPKIQQKLVLIVRSDLCMSTGKIASQCAHAALSCFLIGNKGFKNFFTIKSWIYMGQPKIVLKVNSEQELISLSKSASEAGLITTTVRDAGKTQIKPGTITVLGIGPGNSDRISSITSHLKLL
ncbi:PREDICTED: peptidyl-tRNA hydrolase 2, mitochondrial-like [Ceratosolen solmsi marchali]|uniref:peptidyl-tRNA hydrolase n=1 Tax=Ceratosolen solmsi marchali TaxID=326594 RepID=A0AAJ6VKJ0_9HYME|nr:PREDICTED: peptidyl-tRNA hydrolase 2, mitochondrial-like [Ceratosolen solmsi marchali]